MAKEKGKQNTENENSNKAKSVDRQYKKMERSAKFWNKVDPANKFRHWYLGAASFTRSLFRVVAAWQTIVILLCILVILYILAAFYTGKGEFVVKLDRPLADEGFYLSETTDFSKHLVTLRDDAVEDVTNISMDDIPDNVMDIDGKHNGEDYLAFTFYLKNATGETKDYNCEMNLRTASKKAETATWIMLFYNGKQKVFAQENKNGEPECLYRRWDIPFAEYAAEPEYMTTVVKNESDAGISDELMDYYGYDNPVGLNKLTTYPWKSKKQVCFGTREKIKNNEVDKYTVVIWLEGDDGDCTDELLGGHVEFNMKFTY